MLAGMDAMDTIVPIQEFARLRAAGGSLDRLATLAQYGAGEPVYRCNDPNEHWYHVIRGAARKCALSADGRRHIVDFLLPGDFFGFTYSVVRQFCVEALFHATLIARYPRAAAEHLADSDPQIARMIRELAFSSIARLQRRMVILSGSRALERVSAFLLQMADRDHLTPADTVFLPMSRYDIADYLGLAVETVSRALTELRDRRVIVFTSVRRLRLCDRNALEELADGAIFTAKVQDAAARGASGSSGGHSLYSLR
jgi:CRP/FNR family transcriptional regulator, nitrogen fixation regulation protein